MFQKPSYRRLEQSIIQAQFDETLCDEIDKAEADIQADLEWLYERLGTLISTEGQISICLRYLNHFIQTRGPAAIRSWCGLVLHEIGSSSRCVVKELVPFLSALLEKDEGIREPFFEEGFFTRSPNIQKALIEFGHTNTKVSKTKALELTRQEFFLHLSSFLENPQVERKTYGLHLLASLVPRQAPKLYTITDTPVLSQIIHLLQVGSDYLLLRCSDFKRSWDSEYVHIFYRYADPFPVEDDLY